MTSLPDTNQLLDCLGARERELFLADCEIVDLELGQILAEPGEQILQVQFPINCLIVLLAGVEKRARVSVTMVGNEGMHGIPLVLDAQTSQFQALVQGGGTALRISAASFLSHLKRAPTLEKLIKRYTNVVLSQISQCAACTHYHTVEARLACYLLMTHDRTVGDQLRLTHGFISSMQGVRRAGITRAAQVLRKRGLIDYCRGKITVHDRLGLERASCRCYVSDQEIYAQMIGQPVVRRIMT